MLGVELQGHERAARKRRAQEIERIRPSSHPANFDWLVEHKLVSASFHTNLKLALARQLRIYGAHGDSLQPQRQCTAPRRGDDGIVSYSMDGVKPRFIPTCERISRT
jgi:hypothetical protein